jgi:hypothetical protein
MYSYFSELHVDLFSRALLQPGEQLVGKTVAEYSPWWLLGLFRKTFLALATNQRLILVEHRMAWLHASLKLHGVESIPWGNVEEIRMKGLLFGKKIRLRAQTERGPRRLTMGVPNALFGLLAPMRNNMGGAKAVVGAFQSSRMLTAPPPAHASLPPAPPFGGGQGLFGPQASTPGYPPRSYPQA